MIFAIAVDDVKAAQYAVIAAGGGRVGDIASLDIPGRGKLSSIDDCKSKGYRK